jgi:hypothetical protein
MFGPRAGMRLMIGGMEVMKSAADVLSLTPEELMTQLRDGKSLADVAEAQGVGVDKLKADLLAQVKSELDTAVSDGKITQSQADEVYSRVKNNIDTIINATGPFRGGCPGGPGPGAEMMPGSSENAMPGSTVQPGLGL